MKQSDNTIRPKEPPKTSDLNDESGKIDLGLLQGVGIGPEQKIKFPIDGVKISIDLAEMLNVSKEEVVTISADNTPIEQMPDKTGQSK